MHTIVSLVRRVDRIPILIAAAALFALMVMTFFDVILRSSFNNPIEAATELTRIFVAVIVFSVMPHVSVSNQHICVDLTDPVFHRLRLSRLRDGLVYIVCAIMLIWPTKRVFLLAERTRDYGDVTEYLGIPQFYIMWFIAISLSITAVAMIITGVLKLFAPDMLREDD